MGRKPNPIISKHFTRGAKLGDASNRYQWTCKQCGERFPKGRIDALYNHLSKKCTALSLKERKGLVLEIHNLSPAADALGGEESHLKEQNCDRLNMLAEAVANQHNYPSSYPPPPYSHTFTKEDEMRVRSMVLDPALENDVVSSSHSGEIQADILAQQNGKPFCRSVLSMN
jgi:hypothetical protein